MASERNPAPPGGRPEFLPSVNAVRGLLVGSIVLLHLLLVGMGGNWVPTHVLPRAAYESIFLSLDGLICLSGFVLFLPIAARGWREPRGAFLVRRLVRLAVPYWLSLAAIALVLAVGLVDPAPDQPRDVGAFAVHVLFLQHIVYPFRGGLGMDGPLWALTLFALAPFVVAAVATPYRRHPVAGLAVAVGVVVGWRVTQVYPENASLGLQPPLFLADLAAGMTAAALLVRLRGGSLHRLARRAAAPAAAVALAGTALVAYAIGSTNPHRLYFFEGVGWAVAFPVLFASLLLALALLPASRPARLLAARPLQWLGNVSYPLFLEHFIVISIASRALGVDTAKSPAGAVKLAAVSIPVALLAAWLTHLAVERPSRQLARRAAAWVARRTARAASPAAEPQDGRVPFVGVVNGVRGYVIAAIVLLHVVLVVKGVQWLPNHQVPRTLWGAIFLTVDSIFLVSGFVLFLPVVTRGRIGDRRAFGVRRLLRIAPLYYVCLAVIAVAYPLLMPAAEAAKYPHDLGAYAAHLAFVHNLVLPANTGMGVDGPMWVVTVEATFYVVLAAVAALYLRRPWVGLVLAVALSAGWRVAFSDAGSYSWMLQFPLFAVDFAAGMTAAWVFVRLRARGAKRVRRWAPAVALAGAAAVGATVWATGSEHGMRVHDGTFQLFGQSAVAAVAFPLALGVAIVALALSPGALPTLFTNRFAQWLGKISFALYLVHFVVISFLRTTVELPSSAANSQVLVLAAVVLPASLGLAWLAHLAVERPARDAGRRWARALERSERRFVPQAQPAPSAAVPDMSANR